MNGFYITSTGEKVILEPSDIIVVSSKDIIELVIPNGAKDVYCFNNKLTKLICPDSVDWIDCCGNQLTELYLPDSITYIHCKSNNLTELIVPDNCKVTRDPYVKLITRTMYNRSKRLKNLLK